MRETGVFNHCNALLFLHRSLMVRGQETLNRLFLLAVKFRGKRRPPAPRCKHHYLLRKHPKDWRRHLPRTRHHSTEFSKDKDDAVPHNPAVSRASVACLYFRECTAATSSRESVRVPVLGTERHNWPVPSRDSSGPHGHSSASNTSRTI